MNTIKRDVYVLRNTIKIPIEVTKGTNALTIEFTIRDYKVPTTASAVAYTYKNGMDQPRSVLCNVSGNVISFAPSKDFFEVGTNELQIRLINNQMALLSFTEKIKCSGSLRLTDSEETKDTTLIEQILTRLGKIEGVFKKLKSAAYCTVINNYTTTVADTVLDGRAGKTLNDKIANINKGFEIKSRVIDGKALSCTITEYGRVAWFHMACKTEMKLVKGTTYTPFTPNTRPLLTFSRTYYISQYIGFKFTFKSTGEVEITPFGGDIEIGYGINVSELFLAKEA